MTCEKAESHLSAYLDDMLDPQLRQEVAAHVESCAHCAEVLADYRRVDALLASTIRVSPSDALHDRIFGSPELAAILREQSGGRGKRTSVPLLERPTSGGDAPGGISETPTPMRVERRGSSPPWRRVALQSAAVLALLLGSALLIKQGLLHTGGTTGRGPQTIGGHGMVVPLAAGPRAVYERGGALWSAPENGPGLAQQLTPAGVRVAGWAISSNGRTIAYVDGGTGSVHTIRSDDQNDRSIAASTSGAPSAGFWTSQAGKAVAGGLSWSPDGRYLAYVAADGSGQTVLHIVSAGGGGSSAMGGAASWTGAAVWSADSTHLAFAQSDAAGGQTISVYDATTHQAYQLSTADPAEASAAVAQMAWLTSTPYPSLTWTATVNDAITGVFTQPAASGTSATRLSRAGTRYSAADFTASGGADVWMVAQGGTLATLPVSGASQPAESITLSGSPVTRIVWSPSGAAVAYLTQDGQLALWTPGGAPVAVASHVIGMPVWSPDSTKLAVQLSDSVVAIRLVSGTPASLTRLVSVVGHVALSWSPDSQVLAIGSSSGVLIAGHGTLNGADTLAPDTGAIIWTIAG